MPIKDTEEGALWPVLSLPGVRLQNIENDGDSVLVIVSNDALICVGSVGSDDAVPLA